MSNTGILKPSDDVVAAFQPILAALPTVRSALSTTPDVVAIRPGYHHPAPGDPVPAGVVAVTPGTILVTAAELSERFHFPFSVIDATVEEQLNAISKPTPLVRFGPEQPAQGSFESLLTNEGAEVFGPPKTGAYEPLEPEFLPL